MSNCFMFFVWCAVLPISTSTTALEKKRSWSCSFIWSSSVSACVTMQWLLLSHHASADLSIAKEVKNLLNLSMSSLCFQIPFRNSSSLAMISQALSDLFGLNQKMYPLFEYILVDQMEEALVGVIRVQDCHDQFLEASMHCFIHQVQLCHFPQYAAIHVV